MECGSYQICEHDILKTNEPVLMTIGTSDPRGKYMQWSIWGSGGERSRSHEAEDRLRDLANIMLVLLGQLGFHCVFLPRDAMHKRGICRHAVSVCHVRELRQNE